YNFTMNFTANDTAANQTGVGTITVHVTDHTAPDAPTALVAVAGDANVTVNWTAPTEDGGEAITGYVVYRGNSTENISVLKELGVVLEYRDDTAENDEEYFYAVAAVNVMGEGAKSDAASATPEAPHMTIVSVEEVYVALDEYLNLTWNATLPLDSWTEEGWKLYNDTVEIANGTYDSGVEVDVNVSANLTIEGDYTFTMNFTANDTAANVTVGTTITVHVGNFTAPDNTTALAAVAGDGNITLTWTAPAENGGAPITSYRVYRGEAEDSLTILMTVEDTELLDATAVNGVKYFYAVAAVNVIGEGEQGGVINATPATVPDAPVSLAAAAGDTNVTLTWDAPADNGGADITEYVVYRGDAADSLVALTDTVTVLEFLDTGLTNDVKYFYAVAAVNSVGEGAQCTDVNATPVSSATVPGAPLNLETFSFDAEVDLTWDVPTDNGGVDITSYVVYRGDAADNLTMLIDSLTSTLYDDTSVTNDVIYFYAVAAVNSVGEGAQCTAVSATPEEIYTGPSFEDITISASGTTKTIGVFNGVNFTKGGEDYVAMIYAVTSAKVTVIIGSNLQATTPTVQWVNVTVGSTMNVDTDGNGKSDLAITANSVDATAQTTSMTLKTLAEEEDDDGNGMLIAIILVVVIVVVLLLVVMMKKKGGAPTGSITEVVEEPVEEVVEEEVVEEEVLEEVE
ncbi:MAG: fibronectin type III domain-containing protein, partial [Thermoplasmata archaeon]|nr:fibronectin type III domain-containing protein [Thermoplasmata archaeon]